MTPRAITDAARERLLGRIEESGLTMAEVARRGGMHREQLRQWTRGQSAIVWWRLPAVAAALGVSPAWILFGDEA